MGSITKGSIGKYRKPDGKEEVRIHFPSWELDGKILHNVTVFPHLCVEAQHSTSFLQLQDEHPASSP